jgi:bacterioferritin-associated ferredoxin
MKKTNIKPKIHCLCNSIPMAKVKHAIETLGAKTSDEVYDMTGAGVGPCGGSCREKTDKMIADFLKTIKANGT